MAWIVKFLTSSIGQKLVMSLTGLFLILFLVVHLIGNLQLLYNDGGEAFNLYAEFMVNNPIIGSISWGLYAFILLHAIQGILLKLKNRKAKGHSNSVSNRKSVSWASNNMALLGILIFAFLLLHMGDFWVRMKFDFDLASANYDGVVVKDLYAKVALSFSNIWIVIAYLVGLLALAFHLWHGFESAFQSLGLNHKKYTPIISFIGKAYSILIPIAFAIIPIWMFINKNS